MKIIATDIANLTDARYFAAWGVDGLAYNIDPLSENSLNSVQIKEIADWVEGPTTMLKLDGLEVPEVLGEVRSNIDIKNIIVGPFIDSRYLLDFEKLYRICTLEDGWQDSEHLILSFPYEIKNITDLQKEKIIALTSEKEVFLDANFSSSDLGLIKQLGFNGIILKGGEEEKVGFKSYDELDEILEAIFE
jgi:phosphoribosylanthranilate isomerase